MKGSKTKSRSLGLKTESFCKFFIQPKVPEEDNDPDDRYVHPQTLLFKITLRLFTPAVNSLSVLYTFLQKITERWTTL